MTHSLAGEPATDPAQLYRYRDGLYAQDMLITALVWLDLFTSLQDAPADMDTICRRFDLKTRPADVMLTLLVAMGLLRREEGIFHVTDVAREHLVKSSPWYLGPYYASLKERPVCKDLLNVLKTGRPANWGSEKDKLDWHKSMERPDFAEQFTAAMDCRGVYLARMAAKVLDLNRHRRLLDIAGGSGIYACSFSAHFPKLRATVLEKPPVDEVTRQSIARRGFAGQVDVTAGDMLAAALPRGFDVHLYSNVLHDWDVPTVRDLIQRSFDALEPGGMLVIHDAHLNDEKTGPLHVAEYSVMLMHACEGRCYSTAEIREYLHGAGFVDVSFHETAAARSVMTAQKKR